MESTRPLKTWLWGLAMLVVAFNAANSADEDPLQDFCVGAGTIPLSGNTLNGFPCKPSSEVTASDFKFTGLATGTDASLTQFGSDFTAGSVQFFPGVNTLGLSATRLDFAVGGINPPHLHPRGSELFYVLNGTLEVAFISGNANTLYKETVTTGELFVFPKAILHYQKNVGDGPAVALAFFNTQNAGLYELPTSLKSFPEDVLNASFYDLLSTAAPSASTSGFAK